MGCAVVTMKDPRMQTAILALLGGTTFINDIKVTLKPHMDKDLGCEVPTDIFIGWGYQIEKTTPLPGAEIAEFFDGVYREIMAMGLDQKDLEQDIEEDLEARHIEQEMQGRFGELATDAQLAQAREAELQRRLAEAEAETQILRRQLAAARAAERAHGRDRQAPEELG